jgi:glutaminase
MLRERPRAYLTSVFVISLALTSISVLEQKTSPVAPNRAQFNSVPAVADLPTHTGNPYVNAGAIATVSLISGRTADEKWNKVLNFYSRAAGEKFQLIDEVYKSEAATNTGNKALSMPLARYDRIYADRSPTSLTSICSRRGPLG